VIIKYYFQGGSLTVDVVEVEGRRGFSDIAENAERVLV